MKIEHRIVMVTNETALDEAAAEGFHFHSWVPILPHSPKTWPEALMVREKRETSSHVDDVNPEPEPVQSHIPEGYTKQPDLDIELADVQHPLPLAPGDAPTPAHGDPAPDAKHAPKAHK